MIRPIEDETHTLSALPKTKSRSDFGFLKKTPRGARDNTSERDPAEAELNGYLDDSITDEQINPLEYWKINSHRFPKLAKLAKEVFSCQASTARIERCFNRSRLIISDRRTRPADDSPEMQMFSNISCALLDRTLSLEQKLNEN